MKKLLSIILVAMMLVSCLCLNAFAAATGYAYQWDDTTGAYMYADFAASPAKWEFDIKPLSSSSTVYAHF